MEKKIVNLGLLLILLSGCGDIEEEKSDNVLEKPMIEWIKLDSAEKRELLSEAMEERGYEQKEYREYINSAIREMNASVEDPAVRQIEIGNVIETMSTNMESYMDADLTN